MEEKDIVNTTAEELSSAKPDYEKEIASIIRSNASLHRLKTSCLIIMKMILPLHLTA